MQKPFLAAAWRNLLMANYPIDPAVLQPHLPRYTEPDTFNGIHYVSLVGFLFDKVKIYGITFPFHDRFEEVNLRFYVRYKENGKWKRGVVFMKEIVPLHMVTFIANTLYGENYATHKMKHVWEETDDALHVQYAWKVGQTWNHINCIAEKKPSTIIPGSAEEFITEHYWGYTFIDNASTGAYEVIHPQWMVHAVKQYDIICSTRQLYGAAFEEALNNPPTSVFLAAGSPIQVMKNTKITGL